MPSPIRKPLNLVEKDEFGGDYHISRARSFMPDTVPPQAVDHFLRLATLMSESGRLEQRYGPIIEQYARVKAELEEMQDYLEEHGKFYECGIQQKQRPQSIYAFQLMKAERTALKDLALTPVEEARMVKRTPSESKNPFKPLRKDE